MVTVVCPRRHCNIHDFESGVKKCVFRGTLIPRKYETESQKGAVPQLTNVKVRSFHNPASNSSCTPQILVGHVRSNLPSIRNHPKQSNHAFWCRIERNQIAEENLSSLFLSCRYTLGPQPRWLQMPARTSRPEALCLRFVACLFRAVWGSPHLQPGQKSQTIDTTSFWNLGAWETQKERTWKMISLFCITSVRSTHFAGWNMDLNKDLSVSRGDLAFSNLHEKTGKDNSERKYQMSLVKASIIPFVVCSLQRVWNIIQPGSGL